MYVSVCVIAKKQNLQQPDLINSVLNIQLIK